MNNCDLLLLVFDTLKEKMNIKYIQENALLDFILILQRRNEYPTHYSENMMDFSLRMDIENLIFLEQIERIKDKIGIKLGITNEGIRRICQLPNNEFGETIAIIRYIFEW